MLVALLKVICVCALISDMFVSSSLILSFTTDTVIYKVDTMVDDVSTSEHTGLKGRTCVKVKSCPYNRLWRLIRL
jgi:hypothetical protein